jgi:hypothetical protein
MRSMTAHGRMQGPALLGALLATTHHPGVRVAGRRAAAAVPAKGY